jgi:DNA invertase Pin-like site-specific DNA recombinase
VERDLIRTRTAEGRSRAKARGKHMGRTPSLTPAAAGGSPPAPRGGRDLERPRPILQRQHGHDFEAQEMSAGSTFSASHGWWRPWADE